MHPKTKLLLALLAGLSAASCADNQAVGSLDPVGIRTVNSKVTSTPTPNTNPQQVSGRVPTASASPEVTPSPMAAPTTAPVTVTSVDLGPVQATLDLPGNGSGPPVFPSSAQFLALVTHSDGSTTTSVIWSTDATGVVQVAGGLVTALSTGSAHIFAAAIQDPSRTATASVVVLDNGLVGITID